MAQLNISIDINDEEFKNLCIDNINDLPKEKLQEILLKAVEVALIRDKEAPVYDKDTNILVVPYNADQWGTIKYKPTQLMRDIIHKIDTEKYFGELVDSIGNYIRDNYPKMVEAYIISAFSSMLFKDLNEYNLEKYITNILNDRK